MLRTLAFALPALALSANAPAYGQEASSQPKSKDEIVVTGDPEQKKTIHRYINATLAVERAGQYARFEGPICPSAIGFNEEVGAYVETRIRAVAEAGGADVANLDCDPNFHLLLVEDGPTAMEDLRQQHSRAFGRLAPYERQRLANGGGPVYNWHRVTAFSTDDNLNRSDPGTGLNSDNSRSGGPYGFLTSDSVNAGRTHVKSRIRIPVRQGFDHSFVLIERDAVLGLSPRQIADFATMRGLVRTKEGEPVEVQITTILDLFEDESPVRDTLASLSIWDLALLKSLYSAPLDMNAHKQRSRMASTFQKVLVNGE